MISLPGIIRSRHGRGKWNGEVRSTDRQYHEVSRSKVQAAWRPLISLETNVETERMRDATALLDQSGHVTSRRVSTAPFAAVHSTRGQNG